MLRQMLKSDLAQRLRPAFDDDRDADTFLLRLERYSPELIESLEAVYGQRTHKLLDRLLEVMLHAFHARPADLKRLDEARLLHPDWLQAPEMIGYVAYTDRFAGTLRGVQQHVDYLEKLGIKYLHLMPLLLPRAGENDGGYAVQDYRAVRPDLGTMDDLSALARDLRGKGISLVLDLVLNHVAQEHEWAMKAKAGDPKYRDYFHIYPDRTQPDAFERHLPEVFPDFAPGNFTLNEEVGGWVWTTFNRYQWDLNWANPEVFCEFLEIILYLANRGVEIFRLDAIAFIWKRLGTNCQNQPEVHHITQALRACLRIVAPAVAFKAEAIVSPKDLMPYLGTGQHHGKVSDMAYHNSLMVQLWSSLASRDTRLFEQALRAFPAKPTNTTWGMYLRCHDDIGWAISDEDAARIGLSGAGHRYFLSDFYTGAFRGSFAKGLVFQFNRATGDRRISGTAASLAGLETASNPWQVSDAVNRLLMMHTVVMGFGGVPLLYMGDEIAMLNDYSYTETPEHALDNRWVHRPRMDWQAVADAQAQPQTPAGRVNAGIRHLIRVRQHTPQLHASTESHVIPSPNPYLLLLRRDHPLGTMVQVYNFSEVPIQLPSAVLREVFGDYASELLSGYIYSFQPFQVAIQPYAALWFVPAKRP